MRKKVYPLWPLIQAFRLMELNVNQIMQLTALDTGLADDATATVSAEQIVRLFESAYQVDGRPDFAIRLALTYTRVPCGIGFHALHGSPNLGHALHLMMKYKGDLAPELIKRRDEGEFFELHYYNELEDMSSLSLLLSVVWLLEMLKINYTAPPKPAAITITDPVPDLSLYEEHLGFKITFGQSNSIRFHKSALVMKPLAAGMLAAMKDRNEFANPEVSDENGDARLSDVIKPIICGKLKSGEIQLKDIAHSLGTSPRTLQRRLSDEGITLQALKEEVRRDLAKRLLQSNDLKTTKIADQLGYSDPATFFKSFRSWYGTTPAQYRDALKRAG
jgi:AraC-like DNA-binding protein